MSYEDLGVHVSDRVGWITLDRPEKLNALRKKTFLELEAALAELESEESVRVAVLTGSGDRAFCAGIDLESDGLPTDSEGWDDHTRLNARVLSRAWYFEKPLVTAVNGYALAAGCNLALVGDLTIATRKAMFGEPEIRHGALSPLLLLPWLTSFKTFNELYFSGDRISAERALTLGLVNAVVEPEDLTSAAQAMARRIANAPGYALRIAKRAIRQTLDIQGFRAAMDAHRYVDSYLLASHGVEEKERLMRVLEERGMADFLRERDAPYGDR